MLSRIWLLTKIELYKLLCQKIFYISIFLVTLVVGISVLSGKFTPPSTKTSLNGFDYLISGCLNGFRLSTFLILLIGALSFASETTLATLKNILISPIKRYELTLAKVITIIVLSIFFALIIESVSLVSSWFIYGFADITDPTFPKIIHLSRAEMLLYIFYTFLLIILPLITIGLMGLFISTLVENVGLSVAISIIIYLVLDFFVANIFENFSSFLFNYYWNYYLPTVKDISGGALHEIWKFKVFNLFLGIQIGEEVFIDATRKMAVVKSIVIPFIYAVLFICGSIIAVNKKSA
ncbi:MAG: ABC transporter permease [Planctomycetota bacterium]|nr:ABC transporter permease [Planctomycetota bacterium]MDI6787512.1 ABC transporter permease [Planctomycetota bacterium]